MYARFVTPVVAGLMVLSTAAFAASSGSQVEQYGRESQMKAATLIEPYDHCVALQQQFDDAMKTGGKTAVSQEATRLRSDAGRLCGGNQQEAGIKKMQQALADIGVHPKSMD